ncbi:MAG: hypothetical protein KGJ59_07935 [Bacteroidota bacterium]|nr:hypothetical protein [Bacteroidota bacterium]
MSILSTLALIIALATQLRAGDEHSAYDNKYVRFEFSLNQDDYAAGETGTLSLFLTPNNGVHVNTEPPVEYEFEKQAHIFFSKNAVMPKDSVSGNLDVRKPVSISFTLDNRAAAGTYTVTGKVKYFFCSETEGWCRQFVQPLTVSIRVRE